MQMRSKYIYTQRIQRNSQNLVQHVGMYGEIWFFILYIESNLIKKENTIITNLFELVF